ncbi:DUF5133 domain-containing protein [Streptomyces sp. J2-1]|uniref:DUF5133 domain-containing protein n=1 Tax=Streptomyces corallincola TaxID=2851888 RepID=UPI001C39330A|nr:DUF5133 domain-containing protein [Streptomyces corallincola]MBV2357148.1 DUF5133 domain-containing protein [Streptomyces corallincola]
MLLPAEKELRTVLARFAEARIEHDVRPTGRTGRALEDASYTLCVMTGNQTIERALHAADLMLEQYCADRTAVVREEPELAA